MPAIKAHDLLTPLTAQHFGGNFLAHRDSLDPEDDYVGVVRALSIDFLRYPGGSVTEHCFCIYNPDRTKVIDDRTGEERDFVCISDFSDFVSETGIAATLTLPTRAQLSTRTDRNGDRFADVDEDGLRAFVQNALTGDFGELRVEAFELGNEYWGSGGMSAVEYGRVASAMARIIDDEIASLERAMPGLGAPKIFVQNGTNFGASSLDEEYSGSADSIVARINADYDVSLGDEVIRGNGTVNWTLVNDALLRNAFDAPGEAAAVDGVVMHLYSKEPAVAGQRDYQLATLQETWMQDPRFGDLDIYVSEWNQSGASSAFDRSDDFGLYQGQELLNIVEAFSFWGVDRAAVWPVVQNTANALVNGQGADDLTPAGQLYASLAEVLPGMAPIDLNADDPVETEVTSGAVSLHAFHDADTIVFFVGSRESAPSMTTFDLSMIFADPGRVMAQRFGVMPGQEPGNNASTPVLEEVPVHDVLDGFRLFADLAPGEILQVTFADYTPTQDFLAATQPAVAPAPAPEGPPPEDEDDDPQDSQSADTESDDDDDVLPCFVATCAYGDRDHPDVRFLRLYRDLELANSAAGRVFVRLYYRHGATLAALVSRVPGGRAWVRQRLSRLVSGMRRRRGL